jgi:hypothetical protein
MPRLNRRHIRELKNSPQNYCETLKAKFERNRRNLEGVFSLFGAIQARDYGYLRDDDHAYSNPHGSVGRCSKLEASTQ